MIFLLHIFEQLISEIVIKKNWKNLFKKFSKLKNN